MSATMSGGLTVMNSTLATGPNVITLEMDPTPLVNAWRFCNCKALTAPQWEYGNGPTPEMEAKGLKASKLQEIVEKINDDSDNTMTREYCCNGWPSRIRNLPWVLMPIGFILYHLGSTIEYIGIALLLLGPIIGICSGWWIGSRWRHEWTVCVDEMRQYVEGTLNEEWQKSNGIRWTVETTQALQTRGRRTREVSLYHIQITDLTPPAQPVPMQQMVQIPVNAQGQQVVMVNGQQMVVVPAGTQVPMMQQAQVQHVVAESQDAGGVVTTTEGGNAVYN